MITHGSKKMKTLKRGSSQVIKVLRGTTKIWENWKPWSYHIPDSGTDSFTTEYSVGFNIPSNVIVTYAKVTAWAYNHTQGYETALATAYIQNGGTIIAQGSTGEASRGGSTAYSTATKTWSKDSPCPYGSLSFHSKGNSFRRGCEVWLEGYQR